MKNNITIKIAEPDYTGGGIYIFTGQLSDNNYFIADSSFFDVRIVNAAPNANDIGDCWDYNMDSIEWQEKHLVKDLSPDEVIPFFKHMLQWIKDNRPNGNYDLRDMERIEEELDTLKGDWR